MIRKRLSQKYDSQFNFYLTKSINEISQNQTNATSTIHYKDLIIHSDKNQYLKRVYFIKNSYGRNQINDRIAMLAEFYDSTVLVKYEHPMMVLSGTKDIFLKRIKRMKKMVASDCSSQQSSSKNSQESSHLQFDSSGFLHTIRTDEISKSSNSIHRQPISFSKSLENSIFDIFQDNVFDFSETFNNPEHRPVNVEFDENSFQGQKAVEHLIFDIDDVDKDQAMKLFKKVKQKQNDLVFDLQKDSFKKKDPLKSSKIVITPIDDFVPPSPPKVQNQKYDKFDKMKEDSFKGKYYMKDSKMFKKQPSRIRQYDKDIYEETIRVKSRNKVSTNLNIKTNSVRPKLYGGKEDIGLKQTERCRFIYHSPNEEYETRRQNKRLEEDEEVVEDSEYTSGRESKKQKIRERAAALLHKVRSEQNLMKGSYEPRRSNIMKNYY